MVFSQPIFLVFLIFTLVIHKLLPFRFRNLFLLIASYFFYGYWDWRFVFLLTLSTIIDFSIGWHMYKTDNQNKRKWLLRITIISQLTILGFFKYFDFFIDTFVNIFSAIGLHPHLSTLNILLPVGISFYTFQTMSYTIDIYNGKMKATSNFINFALFVSYFPHLVAGPIMRARDLLPQFEKERKVDKQKIKDGFYLLLTGYMKKVLVSDIIAPIVDRSFLGYETLDSIYILMGVILFTVQIYFDFSGYSDIARGLSKWLGVDLIVNFRQPYLSPNITEYWRRWHISLSSWLRDYLYIPLGGNRHGKWKTYKNIMITMLLGGLWHGTTWNYVLWGGLNGTYLVIHRIFSRENNIPKLGKKHFQNIRFVIGSVFTFCLVMITFIPFRSPDVYVTKIIIDKLIFWQGAIDIQQLTIIIIVISTLLFFDVAPCISKCETTLEFLPRWLFIPVSILSIISVLTVMFVMAYESHTTRPFIYFQF